MEFYLANFNVMAHTASKFAIPSDAYVHSSFGELTHNWLYRYRIIIAYLEDLDLDIVCLQEVTKEFYDLLSDKLKNTYYFVYSPYEKLLLLSKVPVEVLPTPIYKYTKLAGYLLTFTPGSLSGFSGCGVVALINAHLTGDPAKGYERREIIRELNHMYPEQLIIVGDFNDSFNHFTLDGVNITNPGVATSYSRFNVNPAGFVTGIKENQWETVDGIVYGKEFSLEDIKIAPEGGLEGIYAPYIPLSTPYTYISNIHNWPSDHTLNIYKLKFVS